MTSGSQTRGLEETDPILQLPLRLRLRLWEPRLPLPVHILLESLIAFWFQPPGCLQP